MKKNIEKITSFLLAIIVCITLAACNTNDSSKQENSSSTDIEQSDQTLTVVVTTYEPLVNDKLKSAFIEAYPEVKLDLKFLQMDEDENAFFQKLNADITAGKGPDLLYMNTEFCKVSGIEKMISAGTFADMTPFFEADSGFRFEDYNKAAMDFGMRDGKRYIMPTSLKMPILLTTESLIEKSGFDPAKANTFTGLVNEMTRAGKSSGINPLNQALETSAFSCFQQTMGIDTFDYPNKTVNFNEDFKRGAESLKALSELTAMTNESYDYASRVEYLRNKQTIFADYSLFAFGMLFEEMQSLNQFEESSVMIPVRDEQGDMHGEFMEGCVILQNSPNKQNAYNFMKIILSEDMQKGNASVFMSPYAIPVNTAAFDAEFKRMTGAGNQMALMLTDEQVAQYKGFLADLVDIRMSDKAQLEVFEQMKKYYTGAQTYEQTAQELQNTMEIYISE